MSLSGFSLSRNSSCATTRFALLVVDRADQEDHALAAAGASRCRRRARRGPHCSMTIGTMPRPTVSGTAVGPDLPRHSSGCAGHGDPQGRPFCISSSNGERLVDRPGPWPAPCSVTLCSTTTRLDLGHALAVAQGSSASPRRLLVALADFLDVPADWSAWPAGLLARTSSATIRPRRTRFPPAAVKSSIGIGALLGVHAACCRSARARLDQALHLGMRPAPSAAIEWPGRGQGRPSPAVLLRARRSWSHLALEVAHVGAQLAHHRRRCPAASAKAVVDRPAGVALRPSCIVTRKSASLPATPGPWSIGREAQAGRSCSRRPSCRARALFELLEHAGLRR
jgi:hypothetical protein